MKEPPAGVEPAPRPYKGRVLAVDTTEASAGGHAAKPRGLLGGIASDALVETAGVEPLLLGASEALCHQSFIPKVRTGGVEPPQHEAAGLQPAELADARRPRFWGDRPDSNRCLEAHNLGCSPLTPRPPRTVAPRSRATS
jgi:hypothetical protein